ncbi:MAG: LysR substrate-binding domain-containing protein [Alphaproteobacteria bacterium]|nr:LysR substrate-binding domain-containing protein [Alphaproteobacteria bacterium]
MERLRRELPPTTALVAFEAAARYQNFTHAAEEMGISQAAVSRQIRNLEDNLGVLLFRRGSRPLGLTPEGERFHEAVTNGLRSIAESAADLRRTGTADTVTVAASVALTSLWLMPRVAGFRQHRPGSVLRLLAADPYTDPLQSEVDLAVRFGNGRWPGLKSIKLFDDLVIPVASPDYLEDRTPPATSVDLLGETLLHLDDIDPTWMPWRSWFAGHGIAMPRRNADALIFNAYPNMIQAAIDGQGVALGWAHLIRRSLERGDLVRLTRDVQHPRECQYLTWRASRELSSCAAAFRDWIVGEAGDEPMGLRDLPPVSRSAPD